MKLFVSCFFFAVLTLSAAARTSPAIPVGAELDKFPPFAQPLTVGQIADLNLQLKRLEKEWTGFNLYHEINRYVLETLPVGDLVLVDKTGAVRYRQLCGNRLVELSACPTCPAPPADLSATATGDRSSLANLPAKAAVKPSLWSRLIDGLKNAANGLGDFIWNLWKLLFSLGLALATLGLLLWGLMQLWNWITNRNPNPQPQPVAPAPQPNPAPAPLVAPVAPAPVPPAPQPQPPVVPVPVPPAPVAPQPVNPAPAPVAPQPQPAAQQGTFISVAMGERSMIRWSDDVTNVTYRRSQEGVHTLNWETNNNA